MARGTKPLPEPMLTYHQWGPMKTTWVQYHKRYLSHQILRLALKLLIIRFRSNLPVNFFWRGGGTNLVNIPDVNVMAPRVARPSAVMISAVDIILVPSQRLVTRSFDIFYDLCLNKWLSKRSRRWWFDMPSRSLWRHCNISNLWRPSVEEWCEIQVHRKSNPLPHQLIKTIDVRGPSYLGLTRSISWLLMPWLLTSPGHQQPWYWQCRKGRFLSYLRKDFNYLRHSNVEKWHKIWIYVYVPSEQFST